MSYITSPTSSQKHIDWSIALGSPPSLRAKVIINPKAGAGSTARKWPYISRLLQRSGLLYDFEFTQVPGHAIEIAKSAADRGYGLIISVGGDGTTNEIANGLYQAGACMDVTLGIISTGTGRDYVRTAGIPRDYREACNRLTNPKKKVVDVGVIECFDNGREVKRIFLNFAGLGIDSEITKATTQTFKIMGCMPSYLLGVFTSLVRHKNKDISLTIDGQTIRGRMADVLICNGKYGGGSMLPAPNADLADGLFDIMTIHDVSKPDLLWSLPRIYKGTHVTHPKVTMYRAKEIAISSPQGLLVQIDGDMVGEAPVKISIMPQALRIAV